MTLKLKCMHQSKSTATGAGVYALANLSSVSNGKTKRAITWCLPSRLFTKRGSLKLKIKYNKIKKKNNAGLEKTRETSRFRVTEWEDLLT